MGGSIVPYFSRRTNCMWRDTLPLWPLTGVSMGWFEAAPGVVVAVGLCLVVQGGGVGG